MFSNPFPGAFGLDIGDLSIKMVQLKNLSRQRRGAAYRVENARGIKLPHGLIVNGELQQPEQVRHYINRILEGSKNRDQKRIRSPWVVASLPETQGFIKLITIPKSGDEIIEDDIVLEAQRHIPFNDEDGYYLDWQIFPTSSRDKKSLVLIGATLKSVANSYTYLLESLGLGVKALEIEALAIARSMITAQKEYGDDARVLLDLGAARSSLIIFDNGMPQFSTSLSFSGELLTTALAQKYDGSYQEVERLKRKYGLMYKNTREGKKVWSAMVKITEELVNEIKNNLRFYYSHFPEANKITRITLCGGGANLKNLDKFLTQKLGLECGPGRPWKNLFSKKEVPITKQSSLGYATAIGLAIRASDNPFFMSDMI